MCPINTMKDMYEVIKESDKVVTFNAVVPILTPWPWLRVAIGFCVCGLTVIQGGVG